MSMKWWERAVMSFADAGTMFGMAPASVELIVLQQREREELARQRAAARAEHPANGADDSWNDDSWNDDDDDGDGGTRRPRVPVAA